MPKIRSSNSTTDTKKYNEQKTEYNKTVKHNLRSFLFAENYDVDDAGGFTRKTENNTKYLPNAHLANKISEADKQSLYLPSKLSEKIRKTLSDEFKNALDPYFVNLICTVYSFPFEIIYSEIKTSREEAKEIMNNIKNEKYSQKKPLAPLSPVTHSAYFGDFYGYTWDHHPKRGDNLVEFRLSVTVDEHNIPKAEYTYFGPDGIKHIFTGIPYYIDDLKTIIIEMTAGNGTRHQYLHFNGTKYTSGKLTYKTGACVRTSSAKKIKEPDVKSFILTKNKLPEDIVNSIVPGLLKMSSMDFYITAVQLERLENEDSRIAEFHKNFNNHFILIDGCVYKVNEYNILNNTDEPSATECLAKIKALSMSPDKIIYRDKDADFYFFKQIEKQTETN